VLACGKLSSLSGGTFVPRFEKKFAQMLGVARAVAMKHEHPAGGGASRICSNYLASIGSSRDSANISLKIDHQWSDKNRFFGEWLYNPGKYNNYRIPWTGATFPDGTFGYGGQKPFDFRNQIIGLGNTYTFSPTLINEFRGSFTRQFYTTHPELGGYPDSVTDLSGVKTVLDPIQIPAVMTPLFSIGTPAGGALGFGPVAWTNNFNAHESYTILDNVTKLIGKHTLRAGFVYAVVQCNVYKRTDRPHFQWILESHDRSVRGRRPGVVHDGSCQERWNLFLDLLLGALYSLPLLGGVHSGRITNIQTDPRTLEFALKLYW
jgi:hypothetical protein